MSRKMIADEVIIDHETKLWKTAEELGFVVGDKLVLPERETEMSEEFYISPEARLTFNTAYKLSKSAPERAVKIMMVGMSGSGKTELPKIFAQRVGMKWMRMNCGTIRDPEEWFGFREAKEGSTVFVRSIFAKTIEEGNVVIVLDEFNRLEPWLHNTLFPLLDSEGKTLVHDEEFKVGPNVIVVGTINSGYRYTGTFELDEALSNRFHLYLEVGPPPPAQEEAVLVGRHGVGRLDAKAIVKVASLLREKSVVCSTRSTLAIAELVVAGMTMREAFETVVVKRIPEDMGGTNIRKSMVDIINVELGHLKPRVLKDDVFSDAGEIEEPESNTPSGFEVTLRYNKKVETDGFFPNISIIKTLRMQSWSTGPMSLTDGNQIAKALKEGKPVTLYLADAAYAMNLASELKSFNVVMTFEG